MGRVFRAQNKLALTSYYAVNGKDHVIRPAHDSFSAGDGGVIKTVPVPSQAHSIGYISCETRAFLAMGGLATLTAGVPLWAVPSQVTMTTLTGGVRP